MNTTCSETLSIEIAEGGLHHHQPARAAVHPANIDPNSLQEHWQLQLLYQAHQAQGRWIQCLDVANVMSSRHPDLFEGPIGNFLKAVTQALPYCDALFCDNFIAQKALSRPLDCGKIYKTEIGSRPEEIAAHLDTLM